MKNYDDWFKALVWAKRRDRIDVMQHALGTDDYSAKDKARMVRQTFSDLEYLSQDQSYWMIVFRRFGFHMEPEEQAQLDAMPDVVTIFRGYCQETGSAEGISRTLDRKVAEFFAKDYTRTGKREKPRIAEKVVPKSEILAICNARDEQEVILKPEAC